MRISSNYTNYRPQQRNVSFGHNEGFFKAINDLKRRITPIYEQDLQVHATDLTRDDSFWKKTNQVLNDSNVAPVIKKMIKWALNGE